jgi:hypothetical protein
MLTGSNCQSKQPYGYSQNEKHDKMIPKSPNCLPARGRPFVLYFITKGCISKHYLAISLRVSAKSCTFAELFGNCRELHHIGYAL